VWGDQEWDDSMTNSLKLAVMDSQNILGVINKDKHHTSWTSLRRPKS